MHPPWITIFVIFLATFSRTSADLKSIGEKDEGGNATTRKQREIIERERRLIPYMTYYVAQNPSNPTSPRQNIFHIPITPQGGLQYDAISQVPTNNLQNANSQQVDVLPKPIVRLPVVQNPAYITIPSVQTSQQRLQYKPKGDEIRVVGQIYRLEQPAQHIPAQAPSQPIQSETQPRQVIKVNSVPIEQKYVAPHIYKLIPIIAKLPSGDRSPKTFTQAQPQYTYMSTKLQTLLPNSYAVNNQNYYPRPVTSENAYQGNQVYSADAPQPNPQFKVTRISPSLRPEKNKYTLAKIFLSTTTPVPYTTNVKYDINDSRTPKIENDLGSFDSARLGPSSSGYTPNPITINAVPSLTTENHPNQQQIYYAQRPNLGPQSQVISQGSPEFVHQQTQLPRLRVPQEEDIKFVASVTPISVTNDLGNTPQYNNENQEQKVANVYKQPTFDNFLSILKEVDKLPQNLTPDNIDSGIKTLALLLERLQQEKSYQEASKHLTPSVSSTPKPATVTVKEEVQDHKNVHSFPQPSGTSTPGRPGIDYPIYSSIPPTKFDCSTQRYKGFFGDPDTKCQVWHYCDLNGGQASFLCPNGTIFSQVALTCDWWFNVKCASTSQLYVLNERLYKYILPFSPSFPEDYSGPIVDTYLTAKFNEMEAKSKSKALKSITTSKPETTTDSSSDSSTELLEESQTLSAEV